ncbi:DUF397 domain-containing protein [Nocardia yunnanensis]|uniref:DUF397 domain-containing protein n=1 Tax=Nocardia yunnanensis TaxID=2382165 RepID=A0A386ZBZ1_9NOCA|nr:DUF397 domain-containing protein [Nocardia yunnanensis]AYF75181.1 DUF397 domain-containing protein [Nocardia yunnanensis]
MNDDLMRARWFKSSYSQGGSDCVEVAFLDGGRVGVRDSKDPAGPALVFTAGEWDVFAAGLGRGRFVARGR